VYSEILFIGTSVWNFSVWLLHLQPDKRFKLAGNFIVSAVICGNRPWHSIILIKSVVHITKSIGPKTGPWEISQQNLVKADVLESQRTDCLRPQRYDSNQWSKAPLKPYERCRRRVISHGRPCQILQTGQIMPELWGSFHKRPPNCLTALQDSYLGRKSGAVRGLKIRMTVYLRWPVTCLAMNLSINFDATRYEVYIMAIHLVCAIANWFFNC